MAGVGKDRPLISEEGRAATGQEPSRGTPQPSKPGLRGSDGVAKEEGGRKVGEAGPRATVGSPEQGTLLL